MATYTVYQCEVCKKEHRDDPTFLVGHVFLSGPVIAGRSTDCTSGALCQSCFDLLWEKASEAYARAMKEVLVEVRGR